MFSFLLLLVITIGLFYFYKDYYIKYKGIKDIEKEENRKKKKIIHLQKNISEQNSILDNIEKEIKEKKHIIKTFSNEIIFIENGLYEPMFKLEDTDTYKKEIRSNKEEQKEYIKDKNAIIKTINLTYDGSTKKGDVILNKSVKISLKGFNGECDSIILSLKKSNQIGTKEDKIRSLAKQLDKLNKDIGLIVNEDYIQLKLDELYLNYEYILQKETEKDIEKEKREEERELQKAQRELENETQRLINKEIEENKKLEELKEKLKNDATNKKLLSKIEALEQSIIELDLNKNRIKSQAELTRSGYVYIISNIGSFGERVYKIGMTRRLDPMDRVKELGDASVPFIFDVHALIHSLDAPKLEKEFHKLLEKRRVNKINNRKEFFHIKESEIELIIKKVLPNENITFVKIPEAKDYRETLLLKGKMKDKNN